MNSEVFSVLTKRIGSLSALEVAVCRNALDGRLTLVGNGNRPWGDLAAKTVRAELLNYLFRFGTEHGLVSDFGVQIKGAFILGEINLSGCVLAYGIRLLNCTFDQRIYGPSVKIDRVNLQGSELSGLYLESAKIAGYLLCNRGFTCNGKIILLGAQIDGTVSFDSANVTSEEAVAINASRCKVTNSIFFSNGFSTNGRILLLGAKIGGQLSFSNCRVHSKNGSALNAQRAEVDETIFIHKASDFGGNIKLTGVNVGGQVIIRDLMIHPNENTLGSLSLNNARVNNSLILKRAEVAGEINLSQASVDTLNDDFDVWEASADYQIEGFNYSGLHSASYDIYKRLSWVENSRQNGTIEIEDGSREESSSTPFTPQPYQQLAHVIGKTGHRRDRNLVLFNMERRLRTWQSRELVDRRDQALDGTWKMGFKSLLDDARLAIFRISSASLRLIVGYGYKPENAILCALTVIGVTSVLVHQSYIVGDFTPTAAPILVSERWQELSSPIESGGYQNPAEIWTTRTEEGRDYSTFNAIYYSADLFVPLVEFGQDSDWAPSTSRSDLGRLLHFLEPIIRLIGWVVSALGAAAIAGIVRND